jgi:hypothetical protein
MQDAQSVTDAIAGLLLDVTFPLPLSSKFAGSFHRIFSLFAIFWSNDTSCSVDLEFILEKTELSSAFGGCPDTRDMTADLQSAAPPIRQVL